MCLITSLVKATDMYGGVQSRMGQQLTFENYWPESLQQIADRTFNMKVLPWCPQVDAKSFLQGAGISILPNDTT